MTDDRRLSHRVINNTIFNFIGRIWGILVGIFMIPYIVNHIGMERFGVWAIVGIVTGYFGLLDFGIGVSFVKYISEFLTKDEKDKISGIVNSGFTVYFFITFVMLTIVFVFIRPILNMLNIPQALYYESALVLFLGVALFGLSNMFGSFTAIQSAAQRMDISNCINILSSIIGVIGTIFFIEKGYGIVGLMLNNIIVFFFAVIINIYVAFRIVPSLRFRPFTFDPQMIKSLFRFGYNIQTAKISGMVVNQADKLFIASLLSVALVSFYQLANSIVYYVYSFAAILTYALMPAFSEIDARGHRTRLAEAYLRSIKYIAFMAIPAFVFLAISAYMIMFIWMGYGYEKSVTIIQILSAAFLINTIAQVSASASFAIGRPELTARGSAITIALNIFLSFIFIKYFGFFGSAWGVFIAVNAGTIYFLRQLHKTLNISNDKFFKELIPYSVASFFACFVVLFAEYFLRKLGFMADISRVGMIIAFGVKMVSFFFVYALGLSFVKPFSQSDAHIFKEKLPSLGILMERVFVRRDD